MTQTMRVLPLGPCSACGLGFRTRTEHLEVSGSWTEAPHRWQIAVVSASCSSQVAHSSTGWWCSWWWHPQPHLPDVYYYVEVKWCSSIRSKMKVTRQQRG